MEFWRAPLIHEVTVLSRLSKSIEDGHPLLHDDLDARFVEMWREMFCDWFIALHSFSHRLHGGCDTSSLLDNSPP